MSDNKDMIKNLEDGETEKVSGGGEPSGLKLGVDLPAVSEYGGPMPKIPERPVLEKYGGPMPKIPERPVVAEYAGPMPRIPERTVAMDYGMPSPKIDPKIWNPKSDEK